MVRKLSRALCAVVTLPELSAEPISESNSENEELPELLDALLVDEPSAEVLLVESSRLVSES